MTYHEWRAAMLEVGWHLHTVTKSMTEYTAQWRPRNEIAEALK